MTGKFRRISAEVLYTDVDLTIVDKADIELIKTLSSGNSRKRARLCTHRDTSDLLHEMLIVHESGEYVRPHRHPGKSESTHVIEGLVDIVTFHDDGRISDVFQMGDYASKRPFYYRMELPVFHTLIIRSPVLVFHETTNGPFIRDQTEFSPWGPEDSDSDSIRQFMADLELKIRKMV